MILFYYQSKNFIDIIFPFYLFPPLNLKNHAAFLLLLFVRSRVEDSTDGIIEHLLETLLGKSTALQIFKCVDLLSLGKTLLIGDRPALVLLHQLISSLLIITKIELSANEDKRNIGTVVGDLGVPLGSDVLDYKKMILKKMLVSYFILFFYRKGGK